MLDLAVFLCGAAVMALELVGSRILAPSLGASLIVWTSLIGVVLGALSLGYWLGGRAADRNPSRRVLARLILLAAAWVVGTGLTHGLVLELLTDFVTDLRLGAVLAALLLFAGPGVLLGMVSPYAARLSLTDVAGSGATVGRLYALSTVGSIAGTFLAGFWLIAWLGSTSLLHLIGLTLALAALLLWRREAPAALVLAALAAGLAAAGQARTPDLAAGDVLDVDTPYSRARVFQGRLDGEDRPVLVLATDPGKMHSAMYLDDPLALALTYTRFYRLADLWRPDARRALMIGGGGYSLPKWLLASPRPLERLDVAEIDPGMTDLARRHFRLRDDPRLRVLHEDGRAFLNRAARAGAVYDVIYCDAFTAWYSVPFQLTTVEAMRAAKAVLADDGLILMNVISAMRGPAGAFFRAQCRVLREVFPQVLVFPTQPARAPDGVQNIMLIAFKSPHKAATQPDDLVLRDLYSHLWTRDIELAEPVLTDDHAPVDAYLLKLLKG